MRTSTSRSRNSTRRWARRWVASLLALVVAACSRPRPVAIKPGTEPVLRIGLAVGASQVTLGGDGELLVTDDRTGAPIGSIPAGTSWTAVPGGPGGPGNRVGLRLLRPDSGDMVMQGGGGVYAVSVTEGRFAMADGRRYRGGLSVVAGPAGLTLVNRVPIESYLAGVLVQEMGARRGAERAAMLAQAVVSRSFALRHRGRRESLGFDAWADVRDQVYRGVAGEAPEAWDAIRSTVGEVITYRGTVIEAYYHSTCGFRTAGVGEAFRGAQSRPYLRPVSDASGGGHYYCERSPRFRWREEWDGRTLRAILSRALPAVRPAGGDGLPRITDVEVSRTSGSGRVGELRVVFEHGDARIPGPDVRPTLRPEAGGWLPSAAFQLEVIKQQGEVARLVASGAGSGHGVGLCQWGAAGRARAGHDYRRILATYFPGTRLERLY